MINQIFDYKLYSADQNIKWPMYFDQFITKDSFLYDFIHNCGKSNLSKSLWLGYLKEELRLMILLKYDTPVQIILVQPERLSFQDQTPNLVLYDIKILKNFFECHAKLYRINENELKFSAFFNANNLREKHNHNSSHHYELFPDSYAKLNLSMHNNSEGNCCVVKDRNKEVLLNFSSCDLIQDPNMRLTTYLGMISSSRMPIIESLFVNKALDIFQKMSLENSETHMKTIISDLEKQNLLVKIKLMLLHSNHFFEVKAKIDSLLFSLCPETNKSHKRIDTLNVSDCYSSNENSVFKNLIIFFHIQFKHLSIAYLKALFQYYSNTQKLYKKTGVLEVIVNNSPKLIKSSYIEEILNALHLDHDLSNLEKIDFIIQHKTESIQYSYRPLLSPATQLIKFHPLDNEAIYHHIKSHARIPKEFIREDSISNCYQHFFSGKIQENVPEKFKQDHQLQIFDLIPIFISSDDVQKKEIFSIQLESHFSILLQKIKEFLEDQKNKKFILNRINIQLLEPFPISIDDLKEKTQNVINKYITDLKQLSIEAIIFHYRSQESLYEFKPLSIEFKNNLGYNYKPVRVDFSGELAQIQSSVEDRRRHAHLFGMIWAYDIPELLTETSEYFYKNLRLNANLKPNKVVASFAELDVDPSTIIINPKTGNVDYNQGSLKPCVDNNGHARDYGKNQASIVIGIHTLDLGLGIPVRRMLIIGDLTDSNHGAISSQECIRLNLAIRLATEEKIPIDWFTASFGVEVNKEHGVESLDASASTCREIIKSAHAKKIPINIIVNQTNIGAQSYWDALAAICYDTRGVLIMTDQGSMALTGHLVLTSAFYKFLHSDDILKLARELYPKGLQSLAGYEDIHGPNTDAMLFATDLNHCCYLLISHHYYTYSENIEKLTPLRPLTSWNTKNLDLNGVNDLVYQEIRRLQKGYKIDKKIIIEGLRDPGSPPPLYLWSDSAGICGQSINKGNAPQQPETLIAEMQIGQRPCMLIFPPIGPLTPRDSELIARAIYKASSTLPVLIIGRLTGFNSDPLSMQNRQLLNGALIVKSIVQYDGVILVVNLGDLIGGSFVVFSQQLNPLLRIIAVDGSKAQVIGGKTAAKVVFHNSIKKRARQHPRVLEFINTKKLDPTLLDKNDLYNQLMRNVVSEIENEEEVTFNKIHNDKRARDVGSFHDIIPANSLRSGILNHISQMIEIYESTKLD